MIYPINGNILVRRYTKPEKTPGGIIIPDFSREDWSGQIWEIVSLGSKTNKEKIRKHVLTELHEDDIIQTRWMRAIDSGELSEDNKELFFVRAEDVEKVIRNTWTG